MSILEDVKSYHPWNAQEVRDQIEIIRYLESGKPLYNRESDAHLTASAWVVSPDRQQVLMVYHNLYNSWSWLGGHADGDRNLLMTALREVKEESGVTATAISEEIYSLEILAVPGHEKHGEYVSSHVHLNVTYLLEADPTQPLRCKPDENSQVGWFSCKDAISISSEPWMQKYIYSKLSEKLALFPPQKND